MVGTQIIVLNSTPYSEKSLVLHCLGAENSRCALMVGNASRLMPFFQPLNILDCEVSENGRAGMRNASAFASAYPLAGIRSSFGKNAISMFMAEVLYRALREGVEEPGLFEWCRQEILLLDAMEGNYANFHIRFLMDFASAMGFSPTYDALLPFMEDRSALAGEFLGREAASSMLLPVSGAVRTELCARMLKYLEAHLETTLNIRSLAVLRELV